MFVMTSRLSDMMHADSRLTNRSKEVKYVGPMWSLFLIGHLYLSGIRQGLQLRTLKGPRLMMKLDYMLRI